MPEAPDTSQTDLQDLAAAVQKRADELKPPVEHKVINPRFTKECLDANERGDGCLFATLHRGRILFNVTPRDAEPYVWAGNVWERDETRRAQAAVEDVALLYQGQADILKDEIQKQGINKKHPEASKIDLKNKYQARADRLRSVNGITKTLYMAGVVEPEMVCRESDFDKQPWLLPVRNGVIDLKTGALTNGRPEDLCTRALDIIYDPHADDSPWLDFVEEVSDSQEVAAFLKRTFGYAITGHSHEQFIWVFTGPGRNGKGTMFDLIGDILGPYYHEISRAMLIQQRTEQGPSAASEHKYSLLGKRIIVGAETNKGQKIDESAIKSLTGEDRINCRPLFKGEIVFKPTHTLFLHTNHIPAGLTRDFALVQRLLKVEFPFMYVDDVEAEAKRYPARAHLFRKKDPLLKDRLRKIKPGILRWLVEGCLEWQQIGLAPPPCILSGVDELARAEDYVGQFMEDCLIHHPEPGNEGIRISCTRMYDAFKWWWAQNCDGREQRLPAMKGINGAIRDRGHVVDKLGGKTWIYRFTLNPSIESDVDEFLKKGGKS